MKCWNSPQVLSSVVIDVLRNNFHRPIKNGKCNRENVEDAILEGVYSGQLQATNQADVKFVCDLIDDIIQSHTPKKKVD